MAVRGSNTVHENEEALNKAITTDDLGEGGTMPRAVFDEFYLQVQEEADLLDMVRTEDIDRDQSRIPKLGVGERQRQGQDEATEPDSYSSIQTDFVDINTEKGSVYWDLTPEDLTNNPEGDQLADRVISLMSNRFSIDTQDLAVNGDESGSGFVTQNDGWLTYIQNNGGNTFAWESEDDSGTVTSDPIDTDLFNQAIMEMPDRFLGRTDPVFFASEKQLHSYRNEVGGTDSDAAMAVLMSGSDLTPFEYDIVAPTSWPDDQVLFTDPMNLVYAIQRNVEMSIVTGTDKTHEQDLEARYALHAKDDFVVEETEGAVLATNVASPTSS